jgi:anti-sigma B factor antagonist
VNYSKKNDFIIFELGKEIDAMNSMQLKIELVKKIESEEYNKFIINLADTTYIDSSGIGLFVNLYKVCKAQKKSMYILNPKENVLKVFQMTNLTNLFNICSSITEIENKEI